MNLNTKLMGSFLQTERKKMGMTQSELAEKLNASSQAVSNWERGETLPHVSYCWIWQKRCTAPMTRFFPVEKAAAVFAGMSRLHRCRKHYLRLTASVNS